MLDETFRLIFFPGSCLHKKNTSLEKKNITFFIPLQNLKIIKLYNFQENNYYKNNIR